MTEPEVGPNTISPQEREALAAWTAEVARDRQLAVETKAAAAAKRRRTTTLLSAGLAGVLLLSGAAYGISQAGGNDTLPVAQPSTAPAAQEPDPTATTGSTAPSSPTPAAQTPVQRAEAAAEGAFREFLQVDNAIAKAGYRDTKPYDTVAVSPERRYLEEQALIYRNAGERQTGDVEVRDLSVVKSDLKPGPGNYPYVVLRTCIDVRGVDVLNRDGESTVEADRPDFFLSTVTMNYYQPGTEGAESGGWRVYEIETPGDTC